MAQLIEELVVRDNSLAVKFLRTVRVSSITNPRFTLAENAATPITSAFKAIEVSEDYDAISRTLLLYFSASLKSNTSYTLTISGLQDASGATIPTESVDFTTSDVTTTSDDEAPPLPEPPPEIVEIEDHSVRDPVFTGSAVMAINPTFYVTGTDPDQAEPLVTTGYNDGRVTLRFSSYPASGFINSTYFKAQRKKISREFNRWETLPAQVTTDSSRPWVYVDFPSTDATPVYHMPDKEYFPVGYKFRVRVSRDVGI